MMEGVADASPQFKARVAGIFYLLTIAAGVLALVLVSGRLVANLTATACYIAVTLLFYDIFKPVNRSLSLLAAVVSCLGCAIGALGAFHLAPLHINPLVFFGLYCLLIGYLIFRSTFLPRILGALMALGGLGWLTFVSPAFAKHLSPYNLAPGILGEGVLALWLLVIGLNAQRWQDQAGAAMQWRK
jgi:hypothetical protein